MHPISLYRRTKGWRQSDLAEQLGVSTNAVQGWERGVMPRPATFRKIADVLGVDALRLARENQKWEQALKRQYQGVKVDGSGKRPIAGEPDPSD